MGCPQKGAPWSVLHSPCRGLSVALTTDPAERGPGGAAVSPPLTRGAGMHQAPTPPANQRLAEMVERKDGSIFRGAAAGCDGRGVWGQTRRVRKLARNRPRWASLRGTRSTLTVGKGSRPVRQDAHVALWGQGCRGLLPAGERAGPCLGSPTVTRGLGREVELGAPFLSFLSS